MFFVTSIETVTQIKKKGELGKTEPIRNLIPIET
jgi:hypothetical protein